MASQRPNHYNRRQGYRQGQGSMRQEIPPTGGGALTPQEVRDTFRPLLGHTRSSDLTVFVGPEATRYRVHQHVLSESSSTLRASCAMGARLNTRMTLVLPNIPAPVFETIAEWAYGEPLPAIGAENVFSNKVVETYRVTTSLRMRELHDEILHKVYRALKKDRGKQARNHMGRNPLHFLAKMVRHSSSQDFVPLLKIAGIIARNYIPRAGELRAYAGGFQGREGEMFYGVLAEAYADLVGKEEL
ncbi:hypothetical protein ABW20_dc0107633 [Dactylellina cionopaga]|nr:hypothetical protein ABW20_dc0107633 [Dactylellina cionopaga]